MTTEYDNEADLQRIDEQHEKEEKEHNRSVVQSGSISDPCSEDVVQINHERLHREGTICCEACYRLGKDAGRKEVYENSHTVNYPLMN